MLSSEGNVITSMPHILSELHDLQLKDVELDGELYCHGMPINEIRARVGRRLHTHPDFKAIRYVVFDLIEEGLMQGTRLAKLRSLVPSKKHNYVELSQTLSAESLHQVEAYTQGYLRAGYEGVILRKLGERYVRRKSTNMMKHKVRVTTTALVIGAEEEETIYHAPKNTLGALWCKLDSGIRFKVGTGFTAEERRKWWCPLGDHELSGKRIHVSYQELTPNGVPLHSSFKGVVQ